MPLLRVRLPLRLLLPLEDAGSGAEAPIGPAEMCQTILVAWCQCTGLLPGQHAAFAVLPKLQSCNLWLWEGCKRGKTAVSSTK